MSTGQDDELKRTTQTLLTAPRETGAEALVSLLPPSLVPIALSVVQLVQALSEPTTAGRLGMAVTIVGGLAAVHSARGAQRAAAELALLAEEVRLVRTNGLGRTELASEWFRQVLREAILDFAANEDAERRRRLRMILLRGASGASADRTRLFAASTRNLEAQDIALLSVLAACRKALDIEQAAGRDGDQELQSSWERAAARNPSSLDVLVRHGFVVANTPTGIVTGAVSVPITDLGLDFLRWIETP